MISSFFFFSSRRACLAASIVENIIYEICFRIVNCLFSKVQKSVQILGAWHPSILFFCLFNLVAILSRPFSRQLMLWIYSKRMYAFFWENWRNCFFIVWKSQPSLSDFREVVATGSILGIASRWAWRCWKVLAQCELARRESIQPGGAVTLQSLLRALGES